MSATYFLDTNIFLRALIRENEKMSDECLSLLGKVRNNSIEVYTSYLNIAEVAWTLESFYKYPRKKIAGALGSIANLNSLKLINTFNLPLAITLYGEKNIKLIDCMIASLKNIQGRKMVVVSYDRDFDRLGVVRKEPQEVNATAL